MKETGAASLCERGSQCRSIRWSLMPEYCFLALLLFRLVSSQRVLTAQGTSSFVRSTHDLAIVKTRVECECLGNG